MRLLLLLSLLITTLLLAQAPVTNSGKENTTAYEEENFDEVGFDDEFESEFSKDADQEDFDPLSGYNRIMTDFNDLFYTNVLYPVARVYGDIVPESGRVGVSRFFDNLHFPIRFVNNVFQFKFSNSGEELLRFCVNTTLGLLGFFDPAKAWFDLEAHDEDFGQTLGFYGLGGGFHIVLPILGPSNLRDTVGLVGNWYLDPIVYWQNRRYNLLSNNWQALGLKAIDVTNEASLHADEYESLKKDAVDLYPFFRNVYRQNREKQIEE